MIPVLGHFHDKKNEKEYIGKTVTKHVYDILTGERLDNILAAFRNKFSKNDEDIEQINADLSDINTNLSELANKMFILKEYTDSAYTMSANSNYLRAFPIPKVDGYTPIAIAKFDTSDDWIYFFHLSFNNENIYYYAKNSWSGGSRIITASFKLLYVKNSLI